MATDVTPSLSPPSLTSSNTPSSTTLIYSGEIQVLVATDVAGRGLDIPDVAQVFNFDLPTKIEVVQLHPLTHPPPPPPLTLTETHPMTYPMTPLTRILTFFNTYVNSISTYPTKSRGSTTHHLRIHHYTYPLIYPLIYL